MTPRGFFSVVEKFGDEKDGMVTIRSRVKNDLLRLEDLIPDAKPYKETFFTDYPWRIRVPKEQWADAVRAMAMEVNYSNFKDEVKKKNPHRASVYGRVWAVLLDLEPRGWSKWASGSKNRDWRDDAYWDQPLLDDGQDAIPGQLRIDER